MNKEKFNLEKSYQDYLKKGQLDENGFCKTQKTEMRRAFMGGCNSMLILLIKDVPKLSDEKAEEVVAGMVAEAKEFWKNEVKKFDEEISENTHIN